MIVVRQCQHFSSYHYCHPHRHHHHHHRSSSCNGCGIAAISSIFPLAYVRLSSIASPPTLARSTHHHLLITFFETFHGEPPTREEKRTIYRSIHDSQGIDSRASVVHAARNSESPRRNFPEAILLWTLPNDGHHRRYARKHARASLDILLAFARAALFVPRGRRAERGETRDALCL